LAASSDRNKRALLSAQAVQKCIKVLDRKRRAYQVESEITAFFAVLAMSDDLKHTLLEMGLCDVLLPLTMSDSVEVQGHAAAALSNLTSIGTRDAIEANAAGNYSYFVKDWNAPAEGIRGFLLRFMASRDEIDQHIGVWTLIQLLESNGIPFLFQLLTIDLQIHKLLREIPEIPDMLRSILRNATGEEPNEDGPVDEQFYEEGNEVISLTRTALFSLKKLPALGELEQMSQTGQNVEEDVPSGDQQPD
jgi:vacuolar protein 8